MTFLDISNLIPENRRQERSLIEIALIFIQENFWGEASAPPPPPVDRTLLIYINSNDIYWFILDTLIRSYK